MPENKNRSSTQYVSSGFRFSMECALDLDLDMDYLHMNYNSNSSNVNPEFGANEPGCGCTFSYNGGAGAGSAAPCCDGAKPYEDGFNDKKRDPTCCCESSRCYQRPLANKKPDGGCSAEFKYVPEFNYPPAPCPPADSVTRNSCPPPSGGCGCGTYQGGLTNKKPECSAEYKYVVPNPELPVYCAVGEKCCGAATCNTPDTYESIANTDAQRYKGKGPDRKNFYADDDCCPCQKSNNNNMLFEEDTDWSEIRRMAYAAADCTPSCSPRLLSKPRPSFYCEEENYLLQGALKPPQLTGGQGSCLDTSGILGGAFGSTDLDLVAGQSQVVQLAGGEDTIVSDIAGSTLI